MTNIVIKKPHQYALLVLGIVLISLAWFVFCASIPWYNNTDWIPIRRGVLDIIHGSNPYSANSGFFNPPWIAIPLLPLALFPETFGAHLNSLIGFFVFGYIVYRLRAKPVAALLFFLSPPVFVSLIFSNVDWLPALGLILPPQIGLFFIMTKPQIGLGIAVYWIWESYQTGGIKKVLKTVAPISLAFLVSFAIYGLYPLQSNRLIDIWWNTSFWPASLPIGLILLTYALKEHRFNLAIISGPLLAQYLSFNSWTFVLLGVLSETSLTALACIGYWIFYILRPQAPPS